MNRASLIEHLGGRLRREMTKLENDPERGAFLGRSQAINEAVSAAMAGPRVLDPAVHHQQVYALIVGGLRKGMSPERAVRQAIDAAFAGQDVQAGEPTARERAIGQLAARYESAVAAGNDPDRAASYAAGGLGLNGLTAHLAQAIHDGHDPAEAATAAYDAYHGGGRGGQSFGDALLDRSGNRPRRPERREAARSWDDLAFHERMVVASFLGEHGRGGEEPTSQDISDALGALTR